MNHMLHAYLVLAMLVSSFFSPAISVPTAIRASKSASVPQQIEATTPPSPTPNPTIFESGYPPPGGEVTPTAEPSLTPTPAPTQIASSTPTPQSTEPPGIEPRLILSSRTPIILPGQLLSLEWSTGVDIPENELDLYHIVLTIPTFVNVKEPLAEFVNGDELRIEIRKAPPVFVLDILPEISGPLSFHARLEFEGKPISETTLTIHTGGTLVDSGQREVVNGLNKMVQVNIPEKALKRPAIFSIHAASGQSLPPVTLSGKPIEIVAFDAESYQPITKFNQPLTIQMQYDPDRLFGGSDLDVQLFFYNPHNRYWYPLATIVDPEKGLLQATSDHLTVFDYKSETWQANTIPSVDDFRVSEFSGAATYRYDFWVPQGAGDLQPLLNLNYNSQIIDEATVFSQASWVGMGWSLDLGAISVNLHGTSGDGVDPQKSDDTYSISVGGVNGLLLPIQKTIVNGFDVITFNTADQSFTRITFSKADNSWTVYGKDGKIYYFEGEERAVTSTQICADSADDLNLPWRWSLSRIRNIYG